MNQTLEAVLTDGHAIIDNRRFDSQEALDQANVQVRATLGEEFSWEIPLPAVPPNLTNSR